MDFQGNLETIGTSIVLMAAVVTALGVLVKKARDGVRAIRLKFAEQISDVVFSHPSFEAIDSKVDNLKGDLVANREAVAKVKEELTLNGGESIKDKVNATHNTVSELSLRLRNVEQQLEAAVVDTVEKAQRGGRRKDDPPLTGDGGEFV